MDRIQRALDLAKVQVQRVPAPAPAIDDPRPERVALNREFAVGAVESVARLPVDWAALKENRIVANDHSHRRGTPIACCARRCCKERGPTDSPLLV